MNKEFIRLMIKAKKLEIQGFRALIPEKAKENIDTFGKEIKEILEESIIELYCQNPEKDGNEGHKEKKRNPEKIKII